MQQLLFVIHTLTCISLVVLILLQQGKGADIGAAFGSGASSTVFGSRGSAGFLLKFTSCLAFVFFCTSIVLTYLASNAQHSNKELVLPVHQSAPLAQQPEQQEKTQ